MQGNTRISKEKTMEQFYTYRGHHLVRKNNEIFYGNMSADYVTKIDVQSTRKLDDLNIADKVRIQLLPTDTENLDITKIKTTSRDNLYEALEVAHTWLSKAN
jgi:hypothetical protein